MALVSSNGNQTSIEICSFRPGGFLFKIESLQIHVAWGPNALEFGSARVTTSANVTQRSLNNHQKQAWSNKKQPKEQKAKSTNKPTNQSNKTNVSNMYSGGILILYSSLAIVRGVKLKKSVIGPAYGSGCIWGIGFACMMKGALSSWSFL